VYPKATPFAFGHSCPEGVRTVKKEGHLILDGEAAGDGKSPHRVQRESAEIVEGKSNQPAVCDTGCADLHLGENVHRLHARGGANRLQVQAGRVAGAASGALRGVRWQYLTDLCCLLSGEVRCPMRDQIPVAAVAFSVAGARRKGVMSAATCVRLWTLVVWDVHRAALREAEARSRDSTTCSSMRGNTATVARIFASRDRSGASR
jgi:hypothetical protein